MSLIDRRTMSLLGLAAMLSPSRALTDDAYPSRPIHLIVGFTPGASSDITGRLFARGASPIVGQQIVVENKPGAGSSIAAQYVARAAKDGYTLFVPALSTLTNEIVNPAPSFDMGKDFAPIAMLATGATVLVVNPEMNVHTVAELIALAKAKPGQVLFGSVGVGSVPHLAGELFAQRAGIKLTHVPYQGSPEAVTDLIAGRINMFFSIASSAIGQIEAGQVVPIAIAANQRAAVLPNVPSMAEAGMPDFDASLWFGLLAPAGTPRPAIDKLAAAAHQAMHAPEAVDVLRKQGFEPLAAGPDAFGAIIRSEIARWSEVVHAAGLKS